MNNLDVSFQLIETGYIVWWTLYPVGFTAKLDINRYDGLFVYDNTYTKYRMENRVPEIRSIYELRYL